MNTSTNVKSATTTKSERLAAASEAIRIRLGYDTLEDRRRDALDFHDLSVGSIREIIAIAFEAG